MTTTATMTLSPQMAQAIEQAVYRAVQAALNQADTQNNTGVPESQSLPQWITTADVARAMSVSESTVRWLAREGKITGRKHEGSWRFTLDSVRAYMAGE